MAVGGAGTQRLVCIVLAVVSSNALHVMDRARWLKPLLDLQLWSDELEWWVDPVIFLECAMKLDLTTTNFHGRLGAIICWGMDEENMPISHSPDDFDGSVVSEAECRKMDRESERESLKEQRRIGRLVGLIPEIVAGRFDRLSGMDLWSLKDTLGRYPERDEQLQAVLDLVTAEGYSRRSG